MIPCDKLFNIVVEFPVWFVVPINTIVEFISGDEVEYDQQKPWFVIVFTPSFKIFPVSVAVVALVVCA